MFVIISIQEKEMPYLLVAVTDEVLKNQEEGPTRELVLRARKSELRSGPKQRSDLATGPGTVSSSQALKRRKWWRLKRAGSCPSTEQPAHPAAPGPYQGEKERESAY